MPAVYRATDLLRRGIPFTAMHLYRLEAAGKFPKRFKIIEGGQSVAWVAAEVDAWMAARYRFPRNRLSLTNKKTAPTW